MTSFRSEAAELPTTGGLLGCGIDGFTLRKRMRAVQRSRSLYPTPDPPLRDRTGVRRYLVLVPVLSLPAHSSPDGLLPRRMGQFRDHLTSAEKPPR